MFTSIQSESMQKSERRSATGSKEKISPKEVQEIYDTKGPLSIEFYEKIKNFLLYLQHRYMGRVDEDCLSDCYLQLIKSFNHWDKDRSNIISWIHLVVRNKISSFCYTYTKIQNESNEFNDAVISKITTDGSSARVILSDKIRTYIRNTNNIGIIVCNEDVFVNSLYALSEHPLIRSSIWFSQMEDENDS